MPTTEIVSLPSHIPLPELPPDNPLYAVIDNQFRVFPDRTLGQGGHSKVFLGERISDGFELAVKYGNDINRYREFKFHQYAASRLPGFVWPVFNYHPLINNKAVITMPRFPDDSHTVNTLLRQKQPLRQDQFMGIANCLCQTAHTLYSTGIYHNDISPKHILEIPPSTPPSTPDLPPSYFIYDFSSATYQNESLAESNQVVCSPPYVHPYLLLPPHIPNFQSMMYGVGISLIEIAAGEHPFIHKLIEDQYRNTSPENSFLANIHNADQLFGGFTDDQKCRILNMGFDPDKLEHALANCINLNGQVSVVPPLQLLHKIYQSIA